MLEKRQESSELVDQPQNELSLFDVDPRESVPPSLVIKEKISQISLPDSCTRLIEKNSKNCFLSLLDALEDRDNVQIILALRALEIVLMGDDDDSAFLNSEINCLLMWLSNPDSKRGVSLILGDKSFLYISRIYVGGGVFEPTISFSNSDFQKIFSLAMGHPSR